MTASKVGKLSSTISSTNLSLTLSMKTTLRPVYRLIDPYAVSTSELLMVEALLTEDFEGYSKGPSCFAAAANKPHIISMTGKEHFCDGTFRKGRL